MKAADHHAMGRCSVFLKPTTLLSDAPIRMPPGSDLMTILQNLSKMSYRQEALFVVK
jgi:hypothetical protein